MKTIFNNNRKTNLMRFVKVGKLTFFAVLFLVARTSFSQNENRLWRVTPGAGAFLSGNGHGLMYEGTLNLSNGKNIFSAGVCVQSRDAKVSGGSFTYIRPIFKRDYSSYGVSVQEFQERNLQLFTFAKASYIHRSRLSYSAQKAEEQCFYSENDKTPDLSAVKFSTMEMFAGFGLNAKISKNLVWSNYIGAGTYYHINYVKGMYNDQIAPVLFIGTSLRLFNLKNK